MDGVELAQLARIGFLAQLAEEIVRRRAGGHLTLLRFSSGWKVAVGTPDLDSWAGRHEVAALPTYPTLEAALEALVIGVPEIPEVDIAAIHARWEADERATLPAVERSLGIDDESDT